MKKKDFSKKDILRMSRGEVRTPGSSVKQLIIGSPWLEEAEEKAIQHCLIRVDDVEKDVVFSVDRAYGKYLCFERADAYLIGLLSLAMRERCDIVCEVPLSGELLHQLETELIPALVKYAPQLHTPRIIAEVQEDPVESEGKVATGCSCGIDSLFAIKKLMEDKNEHYRLDYAVINNVGAFTWEGQTSIKRYEDNRDNAKEFCKEAGLPLVVTASNFGETFPQNHLLTHIYSSSFAVYMLRKLWGRYYYASTGYDMNDFFGLSDHFLYDSAKYDLLALPAFSITGLRICNQGAAYSRFEKTRELADYPPAWSYLSVCLSQGRGHCGECSKCKRTMWILDALGKLDRFASIMPEEKYHRDYARYMRDLYCAHLDHAGMLEETYEILRKRIPLSTRLQVWRGRCLDKIKYVLKWLLGRV